MRYCILGGLSVLHDGAPVEIAGHKPRQLLTLLLLHANEIVSTDRIIDELWGEAGTRDKERALWVHVNTLRSALEPARRKGDEPRILLTRSPGYLLRVERGELDSDQARQLMDEGRALLRTDPAAASIVLAEALALWRGHPLTDFAYEPWAQIEIGYLEELRLEAIEARIDADLDVGRSRELVGELESLVRQHPLRERFTAQLMLALYRCGRQSEALRSYGRLARHLGEELGVEPGTDLRVLENQVLTGDPALSVLAPPREPQLQPGLSVRGYELREVIGEGAFGIAYRAYQASVGREVAIKVIRPELANDARFIRRFESEARLVAGLEHPHIVPLYDYWREPDAAYLVMPLMAGGSLSDRLARGEVDEALTARLVSQVGSALDAAHRQGVIHRDIKPDNILLDSEGNAYLADFSIAIDADPGPQGISLSASPSPPYASPEQGSGSPATMASDEYSLAAVIQQVCGGGDEHVAAVLARATSPNPDARYGTVAAFVAAMRGAMGAVPESLARVLEVDVVNPYKGLRPFEFADSDDFFGRDRVVERLVARLGHPGAAGRFVAVVGPSGIGKSSIVNAGLVPALRRGALPGSDSWFITAMTPAQHPFEELADALAAVSTSHADEVLAAVTRNHQGVAITVPAILPDEGAQLLLIIDQFEELFTQADDTEAERFLAALAAAVTDPHARLRAVVTLRADFFDRPLSSHEFGRLLRESTETVTAMSPAELEQAITRPAESQGVSLEPALVAEMIGDVVDRTGALPLLQYTLTELFERRSGNVIRLAEYVALGRVAGTLANRAEGLYNELPARIHDAVRTLFLSLVSVGEGATDTRRRMLQSQLREVAGAEATDAVLPAFGRHRLVSFDRDPVTRTPTVEVAHEALLTLWARLRRWIDESRDDLRLVHRLDTAAAEWADAGRDKGFFLREAPLLQAEPLIERDRVPVSKLVRAFVTGSRANVEHERARRRRGRRIVMTGFATAAAVALVLAVVALIARGDASEQAGIAADRAAAAEASRIEAESQALGAFASAQLEEDPELALLLAVQAIGMDPDNLTARDALRRALAAPPVLFTYTAPEGAEGSFHGDLSPDGNRLVVAPSVGSVVEMYDVVSGDLVWSREFAWDAPAEIELRGSVQFVGDGSEVAVGVRWSPAGEHDVADAPGFVGVHIWDAATGADLRSYPTGPCGALLSFAERSPQYAVLIERSAETIATEGCLSADELARSALYDLYRLDLVTGQRVLIWLGAEHLSPAVSGAVTSLSGDGRFASTGNLWSGVNPDSTRVVDLETGEVVLDLPDVGAWAVTTALNGDGSLLAFGAPAGSRVAPALLVYDVASGRQLATIAGHGVGGVSGAWFTDDGRLVTTGSDGTVRLWDPLRGTQLTALRGGETADWLVRITPDGKAVASFGLGGTAQVISLDPADRAELGVVELCDGSGFYPAFAIDVAADRALLNADCGVGHGVYSSAYLVDLGSRAVVMTHPETNGKHAALSADGQLVALQEYFPDRGDPCCGWIGTVIVIDAATGAEVARTDGLCEADWATDEGPDCVPFPDTPYLGWVDDLVFSPGGSFLATSHSYPIQGVQVWDPATGKTLAVLPDAQAPAFAPDESLLLVSTATDPALRLLDTTTFEPVVEREMPDGWAGGRGAFSLDGQVLLVVDDVGITLYDTSSLEPRLTIAQPHESGVFDFAAGTTSTLLATTDVDGFVRIWDYSTGGLVDSFNVGEPAKAVAFADDDRHLLVTLGSEGPVAVFTLDVDELLSIGRGRLTRSFTAGECARYSIDPCPTPEELTAG
jgi:serine/threonine protein kinase/DNA-binding SARP family transcriptional activator/WD40 repeat protein